MSVDEDEDCTRAPSYFEETMREFFTLVAAAIGKAVESPEVEPWSANQNITERLKVREDDYETYIERPLLGYSFNIFQQEFIQNQLYNELGN